MIAVVRADAVVAAGVYRRLAAVALHLVEPDRSSARAELTGDRTSVAPARHATSQPMQLLLRDQFKYAHA